VGVSPALALRGRAIRYKSSFASLTAGFPLLSLTRKQGKIVDLVFLIKFCFWTVCDALRGRGEAPPS